MLRAIASGLPYGLRPSVPLTASWYRHFSEGLNLEDPAVMKKFIGLEDALGKEPDARGTLTQLLNQLLTKVKSLPESAGYRQAVEATAKYRLRVLQENASDQAVEEVLDAHMEELIGECNDELTLIPIMQDFQGYNVPEDHRVPVFNYHDASEFLDKKKA